MILNMQVFEVFSSRMFWLEMKYINRVSDEYQACTYQIYTLNIKQASLLLNHTLFNKFSCSPMFKVRYLKLYTRKTVSTSFHVKVLSSHQFYGLNGSSLADIGHVVVTPTSTACFIHLPRYLLRPIKTSSIIFRL